MKAVLVTGAASGIGLATSEVLSARGYRVFAGVRTAAQGNALQETHPALTPLRAARSRGERVSIVNVGSIGGRLPIPFNGPYNASKFALAGYSGALRQELRPWGIRVSLVEPGTTRTDIWRKVEQSVADARGHGGALYGELLARYRASVQGLQTRGLPPTSVGKVIASLLEARWPAHRRLVGDARLMALLMWLPSPLRDALLATGLRLPAAGALGTPRLQGTSP